MKRLFYTLITLTLVLTACAPAANDNAVSYPDISYPDGSYPNDGGDVSEPPASGYDPSPDDAALTRGPAFVEMTDLLTLESFPLQFMLHIAGNLPTPCNALRIAVNPPDAENNIHVDVYSVSDPNKMCVQVLQPFDVNVSLGSFPAGTYILFINGERVAEFQA